MLEESRNQRLLVDHPRYHRANTLLSEKFCYFGASGSDDYKKEFTAVEQAVAQLGRGHRVEHDDNLFDELNRLVQATGPLDGADIKGKAASVSCRGVSDDDDDSCEVRPKSPC